MMKYLKRFNESNSEKEYEYKNVLDLPGGYHDIEFNILIGLNDESNSISIGDDVLAIYFNDEYSMPKYSVCRFIVDNIGSIQFSELGCFNTLSDKDGEVYDEEIYLLSDAYKVISIETYNDFVYPLKRI